MALMAPPWSWPMRILVTIPPSSPAMPPAKIFTLTLPPEASVHLAPISCRALCQVEPSGAMVPSLMSTSARAEGAASSSEAVTASSESLRSMSPPEGCVAAT